VIDELLQKYAKHVEFNLAPGASGFDPPDIALSTAQELLSASTRDSTINRYQDVIGDSTLRAVFKTRLQRDYPHATLNWNKLEVLVTSGANNAFVTAMLSICNQGDEVIVPVPYYFSHRMALQLLGIRMIPAARDCETFQPLVDDISAKITRKTRAVVLVSPCNPTGCVIDADTISRIRALCAQHALWLVVDAAYEHFVYSQEHHEHELDSSAPSYSIPFAEDGVLLLFTMSKSYALAGWRVGFLVHPSRITPQLLKIHDSNVTHATVLSQKVACATLQHTPSSFLNALRALLHANRDVLLGYLNNVVVNPNVPAPNGAFYLWVRLPRGVHEDDAIDVLARQFKVLVVPGSAFGANAVASWDANGDVNGESAYVRVCYSGLRSVNEAHQAGKLLSDGWRELERVSRLHSCPQRQ